MDSYSLADVLVTWDCDGYRLAPGPYMEKFRYEGPWEGEVIPLRGKLEPLSGYREYPLLLKQEIYSVYQVHDERLLLYHWAYLRDGYGIWLDRIDQGREDVISFDTALETQRPLPADWFFGVSGLHRALLRKRRPVLHASYVAWRSSAILFAAPSGTGKSTQARLWVENEDCEIINGDRVLLGKRQGVWHAFGFPNCGSSQICVNRALPIRAIVVLEQGGENRVEMLSVSQKLRSLVSGMAIYRWDERDVQNAVDLGAELLEKVPVIKLVCRPDREAVEVLKNYLKGEVLC